MTWQTWSTGLEMAKERWMIQDWKQTKMPLWKLHRDDQGRQENGTHLDLKMDKDRLMTGEVWRSERVN